MSSSAQSPELDPDVVIREAPRPLRIVPELPDGRTRRALVTKLQNIGLSAESAAAVGRAVVKPDVAQVLLDAPTTYRVPGAELLVIRVDVYTSRVVADATNPRTLNDMLFPAAVTPGDQRAIYPPLEPPKSDQHHFTVVVSTLDQFVWQLDAAMAATIKANTPRPPIGEQGVMEPPLAVPATVANEKSEALTGVVLIREGSTRVSHAQSILEIDANDLLRRFVADKEQQTLIAELNAIARSSATSISEDDAAKVRVGTMPVDLVVGVRPDAGTDTTLGEAVAAKVAQDHLNHKQEWKAAAKEVHLGEQCVIALHDESLVSDAEKAWLTGRLSREALVDGNPKSEDDRWVELLWLFTTRARPHSVVIRRPIATVLEQEAGRRRLTFKGDRVPLAVALAMRSRRGVITETAVERESRLLEGAVPPIVWQTSWRPTTAPIGDLAETAIEEASARTPGAASAELAARAVWYLAKNGQLSMPRNDLGAGGDRRAPADLVTGMLASPRGIRQLAQAIEDGRAGQRAGRVLDDQGTLDLSGIGTPVELRDETIRTELVPRSGPPAPPPRDPRGEFMDSIARLGRALQEVRTANLDLRSIDDGHGQLMFEVEGIAVAQVDDFIRITSELEHDLNDYAVNWRVAARVRSADGTANTL